MVNISFKKFPNCLKLEYFSFFFFFLDEIYGKQIETTRSEENFEKQTSQEEYRPGWYYVPENEKELRLEKLQTEFHNCLEEMNRLPFYSTTLRVRNRKIELERKLGKIEDEIRFFSRSKVFIKIES